MYYSFLSTLQNFGLKLEGDLLSGRKTGKSLDMPTTTSKPTTTTDRLPINPDGILSHIALEVSQSINHVGRSVRQVSQTAILQPIH